MCDFLFIAASFFGYAKEIKASLEQRGRKVIWFEDRPATDTATKALLRLYPTLLAGKADRYFDHIIEQVRQQPIRDVLVIKGEALSIEAIRRLRKRCPMRASQSTFGTVIAICRKTASRKSRCLIVR